MTSRVRKRLSAEERRARILSAAVTAFAREGCDRTKMDRIAACANVTKPVLYDHFPSKQALFLAVLQSIRDRLIARGQRIAEGSLEPGQKFRSAVDAFLEFVEQEPDAARVLLAVPAGDPVAAELSRTVQAGATAGIAGMLSSVMPQDEPWRRMVAAEFLKAGLHAIAIWWLEHPGPARDEIVDVVVQLLSPGLRT